MSPFAWFPKNSIAEFKKTKHLGSNHWQSLQRLEPSIREQSILCLKLRRLQRSIKLGSTLMAPMAPWRRSPPPANFQGSIGRTRLHWIRINGFISRLTAGVFSIVILRLPEPPSRIVANTPVFQVMTRLKVLH